MKSKIIIALLISIFILAGCQSKGTTAVNASNASSNTSETSISSSQNNAAAPKSKDKKENMKQAKSEGTSKLTDIQKSQIESKFGSAINNINSSLKSLEDFKDIDLSSVN